MTEFVLQAVHSTWEMIVVSAPWLLGGFLLAGFVHLLIPVASVTRHLGRPGWSGVLKAAVIGIPLPLCSCSVIPVASSLRQRGASRGAFASFLISTPETGADSIALTYALMGPILAVARPVAAFVTAVLVGVLVGEDSSPVEAPAAATHDHCCSCASEAAPKEKKGVFEAVHYGFVEMMSDLSPWLLAGFILSGIATAVIPEGFLEEHLGSGLPAMLLMLVVGLPMYVCATSSTPVAAALIAKGLSPGAALVFLLAGPASNLATMLIVSRDLGRRGLVVYVGAIAAVAVLSGLILDRVAEGYTLMTHPSASVAHDHASIWGVAFGVLLSVLILNGLRVRLLNRTSSHHG